MSEFMGSPELQEFEPPASREATIERGAVGEQEPQHLVSSYLDIYSQDELCERVVASLEGIEGVERRFTYKELGLDPATATPEMARPIIEKRIIEYQAGLAQLNELLPRQIKLTNAWLDENNLEVEQRPDNIPIVFTDDLLYRAVDDTWPEAMNRFDIKTNRISITKQFPDFVLAHEYAHGMSYNGKDQSGFVHLNAEGDLERKNVWLDEGCAIMTDEATRPSHFHEAYEEGGLYKGYQWMTNLFLREINLTPKELLQAYYKDGEARILLEQKTLERFGATIYDLEGLYLGFSPEMKEKIESIVEGSPVELAAYEGSGMDETYQSLAKIFPNISVSILPDPNAEVSENG